MASGLSCKVIHRRQHNFPVPIEWAMIYADIKRLDGSDDNLIPAQPEVRPRREQVH